MAAAPSGRLLGLAVHADRRARFLEEYRADLEAADVLGLPRRSITVAFARVALLLLWVRVRREVLRRHGPGELVGVGCVVGLVIVVVDLPIDWSAPFELAVLLLCGWRSVSAWIHASS